MHSINFQNVIGVGSNVELQTDSMMLPAIDAGTQVLGKGLRGRRLQSCWLQSGWRHYGSLHSIRCPYIIGVTSEVELQTASTMLPVMDTGIQVIDK